MPTKKRNCSTFNTTYKKWMKKGRKKGGCGCQSNSLFKGGKMKMKKRTRRMKGGYALGPASLTDFDPGSKFTIPFNDFMNDPSASANVVDARQLPNMIGGRRRLKKNMKKGGSGDPYINAYNSNAISTLPMTSVNGSTNVVDIITGKDNPMMNYSDNIVTGKPFI